MELIDLTRTITENMPLFPSDAAPELERTEEHGWQSSRLHISAHCGTHVECARHADPTAKGLELKPLSRFFGLALMLDVSSCAGQEISKEALAAHEEELKCCEFLVLKSGWDRKWGKDEYFKGYPVLSKEAAEYIAGFEFLLGVGTDAVSADPVDSPDCPVHRALFSGDKIIVENLCNLDSVQGRNFLLSCLPLKYGQAEASPVRAAAFLAPAGIYYPGT